MGAHPQPETPLAASHDADARLVAEVRRRLREYEPLRATRALVEVEASDGRVVLRGRTRTEALRLIAAYLTSFVPGVVAIENRIVSDDQVIREVADALAADPLTAPHVLRVAARYGAVTLGGEVTSLEAEQRAMEVAASVPVVTAVRSEVAIVRPPEPAAAAGSDSRAGVQPS